MLICFLRYLRPWPALQWGVALFLAVSAPYSAEAAGELMVVPTLVELDNRERSQSLRIINGSTETQTYRISLGNDRMNENGEITESLEATGEDKFASEMLRYSPRQVTLKPGEVQMVRISFRRSANLAKGEYRSRLYFRVLPKSQPIASKSAKSAENSEFSVNISTQFGLSVPVFVHQGKLTATGEITNLELTEINEGEPGISLQIERFGDRSLRGDLVVKADGVVVAQANNVAVYPSVPYRRVQLALPTDESLKGKNVVVEYHKTKEDGGSLIASSETVFHE
ncbi:DUF916 domain-containing protein [Sneathiella marina]|uniref:DUF916 domain-containing protein n=1 Tax=Sneathiella marina TaxID=2950108 RepID=A0ABY4VY39_9PROT|nr:DUF916 domain-containing protein [Sneathiella marina]USG59745.1 DUF916 domain-containing protein [Sneathiella marina]